MKIEIENFSFNTIIGVLEFERVQKQRVIVNLEAEYNYKDKNYIDYVKICNIIKETLVEGEFELLEEALLATKQKLLNNFTQIKSFKLKITKPDILDYANVSLSICYQPS